jgi:hypothetical protein
MPQTQPVRLTDEQIRTTVSAMRLTPVDKAIILRKALAGDPSMRFAVYAAWHKAEAGR